MSSSSDILQDNSLLSRIDRLFFKFEKFFALIGGLTILFLVFLAVFNVLGRWFFSMPVSGYIDWVEQSMAVFAFFGIAYCQRLGGHIRMDIVVSRLKGRALWLSEFTSTLIMFIITNILIYGSYLHFLRAFINGDSSMDISLPIWPAKLVVPFALSVLSIRLALQLWAYSRAIINNSAAPVAIPLIEDAATQAAKEAATVSAAEPNINNLPPQTKEEQS
ncbi:MAG: TRAP dicarboxylate transporter, DctQ subunit [Osedax symbiont Rs1]|nr:MAG: TRAP dicarboxylate transporter, DctQ subunit [Osedax symbiont Rs1]